MSVSEAAYPAASPALPAQGVCRSQPPRPAGPALPLPEWKVAGIFSSHMVLQRGVPITVHGWCCHAGAPVTACWDGETVHGTVDAGGRFALTFRPRAASFAAGEMQVFSDFGSDTFTDILVGDVWVVGGQSNAEMTLEPCLHTTPEIAASICADDPFRLFCQTQAAAAAHTEYHAAPARDIIEPGWGWQRPDAAAARAFSALGYYFARLVAPHIDCPLGMVMMCAGGACLRELMPAELAVVRGYTEGANVPVGGYYNTLIAPLLGLRFRGQLFFQGESEGIVKQMALDYDRDLAAFVADERQRFGVDFPFYTVQLCSYRREGADYFPWLHWVRDRQLRAVKHIPRCHLAVSRDLGAKDSDPDFAHSPYKYPLACRLAAQVLAREYGVGDPQAAEFPTPKSWRFAGDCLQICFANTGGGLRTADGGAPSGFAFPAPDGEGVAAAARLLGPDTVAVTLPEGPRPRAVYFAMQPLAGLAEANLTGGSGLPVPAFVLELGE